MSNWSFDVRILGVESRKGARGTGYRVRWTVAGKRFGRTFATAKLADSHRSRLVNATRAGEAFDTYSGLPRSLASSRIERLWVELAREFIDVKWDEFSPRHRKSTAEGLATLTCRLVEDGKTPRDAELLRKALMHWEFNPGVRRRQADPPEDFVEVLRWIRSASLPLDQVAQADGVRTALKAISTTLTGGRASTATTARKRAALSGALNFAVEKGYLSHNPLRDVRVKRQPTVGSIDPGVVVNPVQAGELLAAVMELEPAVHAFFACLYYAGLRPAEARNLRMADLDLPESGWGQIVLRGGYQESGTAWTDDGTRGEERHLKHRAIKETRPVPAHPELVKALRRHLEVHGTGVGGRLFVTRTGRGGHPIAAPYQNPVSMSTIYRVWAAARQTALSPTQVASPLAGRPYDLRHACLSTWLHAGVDSTQVAHWAGHSVAVLMRVYASCLDGHEAVAKSRIEAAFEAATKSAKSERRA